MTLTPCGTRAAYRRHVSRGETPCEDCLDARRVCNQQAEAQRTAGATPRMRWRASPNAVPRAVTLLEAREAHVHAQLEVLRRAQQRMLSGEPPDAVAVELAVALLVEAWQHNQGERP